MNIKEIYLEFSGRMENCTGSKCVKSCCSAVQKSGVDIYPDEVIYFTKKFGKKFPAMIKRSKTSETGFKMYGCLKGDCLLGNSRPVICRGFPVKPFSLHGDRQKIQISVDCPMHNELSQDYTRKSYGLWRRVYADKLRNSFIKKWLASYYLRRLM